MEKVRFFSFLKLGLLILVVYIKADNLYTKTCKTCLIPFSKGSKNKER